VSFLLGAVVGSSLVFGYIGLCGKNSCDGQMAYAHPQVVFGQAQAPVKVIEYSSLGCGACAGFRNKTWPVLKQRHVDTGDVQWILRSFPLGNPDLKAAMLAHCSKDPIKMMHSFYNQQQRWLTSENTEEEIKKIAMEDGMAASEVADCLKNEKLLDNMVHSRVHAVQAYQIGATPAFVIGKHVIPGALSLEEFETVIKAAKAHVGGGKPLDEFAMPEEKPTPEAAPNPAPEAAPKAEPGAPEETPAAASSEVAATDAPSEAAPETQPAPAAGGEDGSTAAAN